MPKSVAADHEVRLYGLPISEGVVLARAYIFDVPRRDEVPVYRVEASRVPAEKSRLDRSIHSAIRQLEGLVDEVTRRAGATQANIFVAQKLMVEDPVLLDQLYNAIENELLNAEAAVDRTLDAYESILLEVDNEYLKERASDIGEIRRRLLEGLREAHAEGDGHLRELFQLEEPRVVIAEDLMPSETVMLDRRNMVGFITERGGRASHAAILARAMGIPAVSGIKGVHKMVSHGEELLINGTTGEVILWPTKTTLSLYPNAREARAPRLNKVKPVPGFQVLANINLSSEVDMAVEVGAEGIGLYRTEFECLAAGRMLTEDEHFARYERVATAMAGKSLQIRLLDLGGDKSAVFMNVPVEENPCLGFRGARLLEAHLELLTPQVRALARASRISPISVVYPMIVDVDQFLKLREFVRQQAEDIAGAQLRHGVMFEVPSACLQAQELLEVADFGSVGSNDLVQYLFAVDRNNELVAKDYTPDRPVFWQLLSQISEASAEASRTLCLCGEIGGQAQYIPKIFDSGIRSVSVSPRLIGLARMAAKRLMR